MLKPISIRYRNFASTLFCTDIGLPGMSGVEAIKQMKTTTSDHSIYCFYHIIAATNMFLMVLSAGATGYLLKGNGKDKILESIFLPKTVVLRCHPRSPVKWSKLCQKMYCLIF
ncbi:MAG: hypothetical protein IPF52_03120 [Saprospiraceae bacterium]|nr:hypothetical protein [Saprospiraceae bacterium]